MRAPAVRSLLKTFAELYRWCTLLLIDRHMRLRTNNLLGLIIVSILVAAACLTLWVGGATRALIRKPATSPANSTLDALPPTFIWAWERPERLNFIDPRRVGVAFLAKTVSLHGDTISVRPRLQPLTLPPGAKLVAVVRIQPSAASTPALSPSQLERTATEVAELAALRGVAAVQVDFDARTSDRGFYRQLLFRIHEQLPTSTPLSMTALASWCTGDKWLSDLPVDEVVPMFFRLGVDGNNFVSRLQSNNQPFASPCNQSAGVSTDEVIPAPPNKRLYIFSPKPWTASSVEAALETYRR
jgi:hypothetical protein